MQAPGTTEKSKKSKKKKSKKVEGSDSDEIEKLFGNFFWFFEVEPPAIEVGSLPIEWAGF